MFPFASTKSQESASKEKMDISGLKQTQVRDIDDPVKSIPTMDDCKKEVYMTINFMHGKVAAAIYEVEKGQISLFSEVQEKDKDFDITQSLIHTVEPMAVIIPKNCHQGFRDKITEAMRSFETPREVSTLLSTDMDFDFKEQSVDYFSGNQNNTSTKVHAGLSTPSKVSKNRPNFLVTVSEKEEIEERESKKSKKGHTERFLDRISENVVAINAKCFLPDKDFIYKNKESGIPFKGEASMEQMSNANKSALLAAKINFDEEVTIRCLVALLWFIERIGIRMSSDSFGEKTFIFPSMTTPTSGPRTSEHATFGSTVSSFKDPFLIRRITYFFLPSMVVVNENTLRAIGVIQEELLPSSRTLKSSRRQMMSLTTIFSRECQSRPGKYLLKKILAQPVRDPDILNYRHSVIEFFLQDEMNVTAVDLCCHIKEVSPLNAIFRRIQMTHMKYADVRSLRMTLTKMIEIVLILCDITKGYPDVLMKRAQKLNIHSLIQLVQRLDRTIDVENTEKDPMKAIKILPGVNLELDQCYASKESVEEELTRAVKVEAENFLMKGLTPLPEFNIIFMDGPGFLLELPYQDIRLMGVISNIICSCGGYQFPDTNPSCIFFKTGYLIHLDEKIREKVFNIPILETTVISDLREAILDCIGSVDDVSDFISELDVLLSFFRFAQEHQWTRPEINDTNTIAIREGRHPLLEGVISRNQGEPGVPESIVTNDFVSQESENKFKVITGPNASGKSIFMKQVCLTVHLALCGSFVPAEYASVPLVDKIITRMKSPSTTTNDISAFMADLKQMTYIIDNATRMSLVAIDEFGKGTRPEDGLALLSACIKYFMRKTQPHILVATHFHAITKLLDSSNPLLKYMMFESTHVGDVNFIHDYKIKEGIAHSSIPESVYHDIGLPESFIERVREVTEALRNREKIKPNYSEEQIHINNMAEMIVKSFMELNTESRYHVFEFMDQIKDLNGTF